MMKKDSEIRSKDRIQIRRSSRRGLSVAPSSVSSQIADIKRVKRVRFADPDTIYPICKPDACSLPAKSALAPRWEDPKTSEYAFYKKLREDAGRNFHAYPLHTQDNPLKKFEESNHTGELTNMVKHKYEIRYSSPIEKFTFVDHKSSLSPPGASRNSGSQSRYEEVFSRKRQKLLQWAAETSSIDINECRSKGYDLVSVLLQRLVSASNADASNSCMAPRLRHMELNSKSQLFASPKSDIYFEDLPKTPSMDFISPTAGQYLENGLLECWSNRSREIMFSQWDNVDSESLFTGHANKIHLQHEIRQPDSVLDCERATGLHNGREPASDIHMGTEFALNRYGYLELEDHMPMQSRLDCSTHEDSSSYWGSPEKSLGSSNKSSFKDLDELHGPNEPTRERELCTQLLGWDDNCMEHDQDLSISSHSTLLNLTPTRTTSWEDDNWRSLHSEFNAIGLHSSSALAIRHCQDFALLDFCSESYPFHAVGTRVLEDKDNQVVEPDHFPVTFCTPNSVALEEGCSNYEGRNLFRSPHSNYRFVSEVFRENLPPSLDNVLLSSALHVFGWKGLPITDSFGEYHSSTHPDLQFLRKDIKGVPSSLLTGDKTKRCLDCSSHVATRTEFAEDTFNIHDLSSFSLNNERACPLLLDESSWDGSGEVSCDYSEDE